MKRRQFTLRDVAILIVAAGFAAWFIRLYELANRQIEEGIYHSNFLVVSLALLCVQLGTLVLSVLPPRPRLRRLARQPGFLAGAAACIWTLVKTTQFAPYYLQSTSRSAWDFALNLSNHLAEVAAPYFVGPIIALVWILGAMQGFRWRGADWVEVMGRLWGIIWVIGWLGFTVYRFIR